MNPKIILCLALVLSGGVLGCSTTVGNRSLNAPNPPADLPVRCHNAQYDFTFFLPASWRGYSVLVQQWDGKRYSTAKDEIVEAGHGPIIVFRNPQWSASDPYQDIPIMVFTRGQWEAEQQGKSFPYAGGVIGEMWHNHKYVFGIYSRYNAADSVKGWKEAANILERNCALHTEPPLCPNP
jgi:hypothetical protein